MLEKSIHKSKVFLRKQTPTILTFIGGAGVVATSVMTAKATVKAVDILDQVEKAKGEELTNREKVLLVGRMYIPPVLVGATTLACIFGANFLNKRGQAALISSYTLLDRSYKEFRDKAEELYGDDITNKIIEEIAKDRYEEVEDEGQLFYDEYSKQYFVSTLEKVQRAQYNINRNLVLRDYAYLHEWYEDFDMVSPDPDYNLGWSMGQCMDMYWQSWIDFANTKTVLDDGRECYIVRMLCDPIPDFADYF